MICLGMILSVLLIRRQTQAQFKKERKYDSIKNLTIEVEANQFVSLMESSYAGISYHSSGANPTLWDLFAQVFRLTSYVWPTPHFSLFSKTLYEIFLFSLLFCRSSNTWSTKIVWNLTRVYPDWSMTLMDLCHLMFTLGPCVHVSRPLCLVSEGELPCVTGPSIAEVSPCLICEALLGTCYYVLGWDLLWYSNATCYPYALWSIAGGSIGPWIDAWPSNRRRIIMPCSLYTMDCYSFTYSRYWH